MVGVLFMFVFANLIWNVVGELDNDFTAAGFGLNDLLSVF